MKVVLTVIEGPHTGRTFEFDRRDTFIVGRGTSAHFQPSSKDKYFSRNHFLLEVNAPLCRLLDLNSLNGTFVNDNLTTSVDLRDGDKIRGGDTTISVSIERSAESSQAETQPGDGPAPTLVPRGRALPLTGDDPSAPLTIKPRTRAQEHLSPEHPNIPSQKIERPPEASGASEVTSGSLSQFPGYRTIREIGRGGMGVVYEADSLTDRSRVAIKVISPNVTATSEDLSRFLREASILRDLMHPNIVRYRDLNQHRGELFIVMDYIDGITAECLVKDCTEHLPVRRVVGLAGQLLEALAYAHERGYVHRDVKPANMLVTTRAGVDTLALADFGLARTYNSSRLSGLTMTGDFGGTTPFMPPEQITNYRKVDAAADQYSAAATLYYLLTKRHVYDFPRDVAKQLLMVLQDDPLRIDKRRTDLSAKLVDVIHKALSRDPKARFPNVNEFHKALRSVV